LSSKVLDQDVLWVSKPATLRYATIKISEEIPRPSGREALFRQCQEEFHMGELLTPTHLVIVLVVALLLFGPRKLPELGKGLGEGLRGFKDGIKGTPTDAAKQDAPAPKAEVTTDAK
jgi:sec-independent protein translocase protein TatA